MDQKLKQELGPSRLEIRNFQLIKNYVKREFYLLTKKLLSIR